MTRGVSATLGNGFIDTNFDDLWVKLHTGDPGAAGTTAAAVGDATRKQYITPAASGGVKTSGTVGPWTNGGTTETLTDISLWTLVTAGVFNGSGQLAAPQAWVSTNTFNLTSVTITFSPIAA